jgi:thioredoxin-related protein
LKFKFKIQTQIQNCDFAQSVLNLNFKFVLEFKVFFVMGKFLFNLAVIVFVLGAVASKSEAQNNIQWVSWEQAIQQAKAQHKKIFIDVYTEGCMPCKNMEQTTFSNADIVQYVNQNYVAVKLDAKYRKDLSYNNQTYKYTCEYGTCFHQLVAELLDGQLNFPSVVFLDENLNLIQAISNYQDPVQFQCIMTYFGQNINRKMTWEKYERLCEKQRNPR